MNFHLAKAVSGVAKSQRSWLALVLASSLLTGLTACTAVGTTPRSRPDVPAPPPVVAEVKPVVATPPAWDSGKFVGKEWRLVTLFGVPANQVPSPRLQWVTTAQVMGSGGCNRFTGRAILSESEARFGPLASTRMACVPEPSSQEDRFFKALEETTRVRLQGAELQLLDRDGAVVAQLAQD